MYPELSDEEILEKRSELFMSSGCKGHTFFLEPPAAGE
jgi:hypothetical protein